MERRLRFSDAVVMDRFAGQHAAEWEYTNGGFESPAFVAIVGSVDIAAIEADADAYEWNEDDMIADSEPTRLAGYAWREHQDDDNRLTDADWNGAGDSHYTLVPFDTPDEALAAAHANA